MRKKPSELDFDEYIRQVEPTKREKFFRNLLMGEHNELKNRYLHVDYKKFNGKTVNEKTIKRDLQMLKKQNLIARVGANKNGYWKVN